MITQSQYIAQQEDTLSNMVKLLDAARRIDDRITEMTDERAPYGTDDEIKRMRNALALKMVAYTEAQRQMVGSMIAYYEAGQTPKAYSLNHLRN